MLAYTSVTKSYLPKARVLAKSLKRHNSDWRLHVLLCDTPPPDLDLAAEPFDALLQLSDLGLPNWKAWAFGHDTVELCTGAKGFAAQVLAASGGSDRIMYLDPDIKVFASLEPLARLLDEHDILLTPHLLDPESDDASIRANEICALQHGVYNLGFFAARCNGQGRRFIDWWASRLADHCIDDIPGGLFTDQRWVDLAPAFFDRLHIVRDRGCNVATWNISHRPVQRRADGCYSAGDALLRFYHFTGFDSGDGRGVLGKYAADQIDAFELWDDYGLDLAENGHRDPQLDHFAYATFSNGAPIERALRRIYRSRADLQEAFPDPFEVREWSLFNWWAQEKKSAAS